MDNETLQMLVEGMVVQRAGHRTGPRRRKTWTVGERNRVLWCEQQTKTSHGNQQAPDPRTGLMIKYVTT